MTDLNEPGEYLITLAGCDDSTPIVMELTHTEAELVTRISVESNRLSDCNCRPVLAIQPIETAPADALDDYRELANKADKEKP